MTFNASLTDIISQNRNGLLGIRAGWEQVRLGEVAEILNGYPLESSRFNKSNGTPVLRIRDILRGRTETFYRGEYASSYLIKKDDIVVGMDGDFNCGIWPGPPALLKIHHSYFVLFPNPPRSAFYIPHPRRARPVAVDDTSFGMSPNYWA